MLIKNNYKCTESKNQYKSNSTFQHTLLSYNIISSALTTSTEQQSTDNTDGRHQEKFHVKNKHFSKNSFSRNSNILRSQHQSEQKSQVRQRQPIYKHFIDANRFSQWLKLRAVIIKIKNLQNKTKSCDQQIIDAENFLLRLSQQQSFNEDVNQLTHNRPVQKRSRLIQLTPSIDEDSIIRSNSRLANASVSTARKAYNFRWQKQNYTSVSGTATQHQWSCWS